MEEKNKGKVLVIDDNEDILFALNLLLKPLVEDIRVTKQPEQIDRFYDSVHPDVVLLDMNSLFTLTLSAMWFRRN